MRESEYRFGYVGNIKPMKVFAVLPPILSLRSREAGVAIPSLLNRAGALRIER